MRQAALSAFWPSPRFWSDAADVTLFRVQRSPKSHMRRMQAPGESGLALSGRVAPVGWPAPLEMANDIGNHSKYQFLPYFPMSPAREAAVQIVASCGNNSLGDARAKVTLWPATRGQAGC